MGEDVDMAEIKDALSNCEKVANGKNLVDEVKEAKRGRKRKRDELSDGDEDDQSNEENVASFESSNTVDFRFSQRQFVVLPVLNSSVFSQFHLVIFSVHPGEHTVFQKTTNRYGGIAKPGPM